MPDELYNSQDYCALAEELESLKIENAELFAERDEWRADAERFIQLANFNNKKASEYFELHEQLVAKYGGENNEADVCNGSEKI